MSKEINAVLKDQENIAWEDQMANAILEEIFSIDVEIFAESGIAIPEYEHEGDSGYDLAAKEDISVEPGKIGQVKTGLYMAIPRGFEMQVRTRSGSGPKRGFFVINSPGTVDSCYRGEVGVLVFNIGTETLHIKKGERIAQGVVCPVMKANFNIRTSKDELGKTDRGDGAFHSTGY